MKTRILHTHLQRNMLWLFLIIFFSTSAFLFGKAWADQPKKVKFLDQHAEQYLILRAATTTTTTTTVAPVKRRVQTQPTAVKPIVAPRTLPAGSHTDWMSQAGIPESEWGYVDYIISHESGWEPSRVNSTGCIGLGQNCPSRGVYFLPLACPNWQSDPICQLRRWTGYAAKYGGWAGSYQHWLDNGNW